MRLSHQATGAQVRPQRRNLQELKEENAGGRKNSARKKKAAAENQGDAILRALEADESQRGKNEGQQSADDLKIALKNWIGFEGDGTQPVRHQEGEQRIPRACQKTTLVGLRPFIRVSSPMLMALDRDEVLLN